jgi:hypothetical protein
MFDQEQQSFQLSTDYLNAAASQVLLKYLLISHFGRGRGRYTSPAAPSQWSELAQARCRRMLRNGQHSGRSCAKHMPQGRLSMRKESP